MKLKSDPSVYMKKNGNEYIYVGIYVDDFLVVASSETVVNIVIENIKKNIAIKETTDSNMFFRIAVHKNWKWNNDISEKLCKKFIRKI